MGYFVCFATWQDLTEKSQAISLFGFPFLLTARQDPSMEGTYEFFIQASSFNRHQLVTFAGHGFCTSNCGHFLPLQCFEAVTGTSICSLLVLSGDYT